MLAASLALVAGVGGSAAAAAKKIVVLKVTGDALGAPERAALTEAVRKELAERPASYKVEDTPDADLIDLMFDAECVEPDAACLADIGAAQGAELIMLAETAPKGGGTELHVTLVDVKTRKAVKEATKTAPAAGLAGIVPEIVTQVAGPRPGPPKPPAPTLVALSIRTAPDGADVFVNGHAVGKTPSKFEGKPGSYTIRITKEGFQDVVRKVDLKEGAPVDLELTLEAVVVTPPVVGQTGTQTGTTDTGKTGGTVEDDDEFYETWWFWTIIGAAAAGTTVGILAGTGAFDAEPAPVGNATLLVGQRPDQDFLLQLQRQ